MSALERTPLSIDLAIPQNWVFVIKRAPSLQYQCSAVKLPDIMMSTANKNDPSIMVAYEGDHLVYTPIELTFNVDINFQNWQEMLNWMKGLAVPTGNPKTYTLLENNQKGGSVNPYTKYSDLSLIGLDTQNNPLINWTFKRSFPIALSGPRYDSKSGTDSSIMVATVALRFTEFTIENVV